MKFSINDFFSKCNQIGSLLKKSLKDNFIFCAVENHCKDDKIDTIDPIGIF